MSWTEERVERAMELWREGWSARQIAQDLKGVSRNAVIGKLHRLGLTAHDQPSDPGKRHPKANKMPSAPRATRAPTVKRAPYQNAGLNFQSRKFGKAANAKPVIVASNWAWEPLPGSTPRPWTERGNGCSWPVDVAGTEVQHSCCRPKKPGHPNYCPEHQALGVSKSDAGAPRGRALVRSLRRYA